MIFLAQETKTDSAAKLAAVEGKPTAEHLFASEINMMRDKINELRQIVYLMSLPLSQLFATGQVVNLGELGIGETVKDDINEGDASMLGTESPVLIRCKEAGRNRVYLFSGPVGNYGSGASQVTDAMLELVHDTAADLSYKHHTLMSLYNPEPVTVMESYAAEIPGMTIIKAGVGIYMVAAPNLNLPKKASIRVQSPLNYMNFGIMYADENTIVLTTVPEGEIEPADMPLVGVDLKIEKFI